MIYNRYIPGSNGIYTRQRINVPEKVSSDCTNIPSPKECCNEKKHTAHISFPTIDLGDVLLLCIAVLLLLESDSDDSLSILIAIIAFIFMQ